MDRATAETGQYYDRLTRWTEMARPFGYGGGRQSLSVHRRLADPLAGGRPTSTRLQDLVLAELRGLPGAPHVLDAGCGLGGTLIDLVSKTGGTGTGLTVSARQAAVGRRAIERAGLHGRAVIAVCSYDEPPAGPFNAIVAIESLAHSAEPGATLAALTRVLAPGGLLVIADDMPTLETEDDADLDTFKFGWRCPVLWSGARYTRALDGLGLTPSLSRDLTADVRPRAPLALSMLAGLNRALRWAIPLRAWRTVMDSHHGGLALERLYRRGVMQYRLIVAGKPGRP
jgi:SAM-dependent methyltransferase